MPPQLAATYALLAGLTLPCSWLGRGLLTIRNVLAPMIIDAVFIVWIWSAGSKAHSR